MFCNLLCDILATGIHVMYRYLHRDISISAFEARHINGVTRNTDRKCVNNAATR